MRRLLLTLALAAHVATAGTWLDVDYAGDAQSYHKLSVYTPAGSGPFPVLVFFPGGLSPAQAPAAGANYVGLANSRGWAIVGAAWRGIVDATWPAGIYDCKAVVRFLRANAAAYNLDPLRIVASGSSTGGIMALLIGNTIGNATYEGSIGPHTGTSSAVAAVAEFVGTADLTGWSADLTAQGCSTGVTAAMTTWLGCAIGTCPSTWAEASAYAQISAASPPHWLYNGGADCTNPWTQSAKVQNALRALGKTSRLYVAPSVPHASPHFQDAAAWDDLAAWLAVNVP